MSSLSTCHFKFNAVAYTRQMKIALLMHVQRGIMAAIPRPAESSKRPFVSSHLAQGRRFLHNFRQSVRERNASSVAAHTGFRSMEPTP